MLLALSVLKLKSVSLGQATVEENYDDGIQTFKVGNKLSYNSSIHSVFPVMNDGCFYCPVVLAKLAELSGCDCDNLNDIYDYYNWDDDDEDEDDDDDDDNWDDDDDDWDDM